MRKDRQEGAIRNPSSHTFEPERGGVRRESLDQYLRFGQLRTCHIFYSAERSDDVLRSLGLLKCNTSVGYVGLVLKT